jgi:hypothetical protein
MIENKLMKVKKKMKTKILYYLLQMENLQNLMAKLFFS